MLPFMYINSVFRVIKTGYRLLSKSS